jgi:nitrogen fixation protein NifB
MNTSEASTPVHPCFNAGAKHTHARVHLPVAPRCNIQCNYCNRKYDCVNESRPGVTSAVLAPFQAVEYLKELHFHVSNISVIGIAGPGDPFANPEETLDTIRLIKKQFPDKIFCLSTNGLNLKPYIDELYELGVSHVTLTINAIDPAISAGIYSWVRYKKKIYRGLEGAKLLLEKQLEAISLLKAKGITVKINTIILPGINEDHIQEVARKVASLGADVINCIPVVQNPDTVFETMEEPSAKVVARTRFQAEEFLPVMSHCSRCRADAAGILGKDFQGASDMLREYASMLPATAIDKPYVAAASYEGLLVNQHLGEARSLHIFENTEKGFRWMEERETPPAGTGDYRWVELAKVIGDCKALLVGGIGPTPLEIIGQKGIKVIQMTGMIEDGLEAVYNNKPLRTVKKPDAFRCGESCSGKGGGCD